MPTPLYWSKSSLDSLGSDSWLQQAEQRITDTISQYLPKPASQPTSSFTEMPRVPEAPKITTPTFNADDFAPWRAKAEPKPAPSGTPSMMPTSAPDAVMPTSQQATAGASGSVAQASSMDFGPPQGPPAEGVLRWGSLVDEASRTYGVPREIIMGIMDIESGGNPQALSAAGAMGLMQVMPFHYGEGENGMDPRTSVMRGAKILADNYRRWGDWDRAAAAYFGAIDENGRITDATDATGTTGSRYVDLFRGATSKYTGSRAAPMPDVQPQAPQLPRPAEMPQPAAQAPSLPPPAPMPDAARPLPAPTGSNVGPKLRVRDKWGNEFELTQEQLNRRPGGYADLTILGPVAMTAGSAAPAAAGPASQAAAGGSSTPAAAPLPPQVAMRWRRQFGRDPDPSEAAELMSVLGGMA